MYVVKVQLFSELLKFKRGEAFFGTLYTSPKEHMDNGQ